MPHLIVEYSANLAPFPERKALVELNVAVCGSPEVQTEADLKTRFVSQTSFAVGTEFAPRGFVHAQFIAWDGGGSVDRLDQRGLR